MVQFLVTGFRIGIRRACGLVRQNRSTNYYQSQAKDQTALRIRLRDLAASRVRYGYRRLHILLRREGWEANGRPINHKRVYRLYKMDGLEIRTKKAKKRVSRARVVVPAATTPNERWSMDFVTDRLFNGRRFRMLTLVDHFSRVSPAIEADFSLTGQRVTAVLDRLAQAQQVPKEIFVDNGPEFVSRALDEWAHRHGVKLMFSRPGTPTDNAYIESFNARLRQECLNENWFLSLSDAQEKLECHRKEYNSFRPHSSLGDLTPEEFTTRWQAQVAAEHQVD